jgi:hypothetical protein
MNKEKIIKLLKLAESNVNPKNRGMSRAEAHASVLQALLAIEREPKENENEKKETEHGLHRKLFYMSKELEQLKNENANLREQRDSYYEEFDAERKKLSQINQEFKDFKESVARGFDYLQAVSVWTKDKLLV